AIVAALVNGVCLWLLKRLREPDVNMRAATTFSLNDFVSNGGIILAGVIVLWTGQNWPDLVVGVAVAAIAVKGGLEILHDARSDADTEDTDQ
ncbi:MAG: cation transporter, partial [Lysobacteraceae bacterium]